MGDLEQVIGEITNLFEDDSNFEETQQTELQEEEVIEEGIEEEADDTEVDDVEDSDTVEEDDVKQESRAQKRIRELVAKTKELEAQLAQPKTDDEVQQLREMVNNLLASKQEQVNEQVEEMPEFDTQAEFAEYIKQKTLAEVKAIMQEQTQPIQQQMANQKYLENINGWFKSNPDANDYKGAMDKLSETLSQEEKAFYQAQIIKGNTSVLDNLFARVAVSNKDIIKAAVSNDKKKAIMPKGKKSTTSGKSTLSNSDLIKQAYKKGDFQEIMEQIIPDSMK